MTFFASYLPHNPIEVLQIVIPTGGAKRRSGGICVQHRPLAIGRVGETLKRSDVERFNVLVGRIRLAQSIEHTTNPTLDLFRNGRNIRVVDQRKRGRGFEGGDDRTAALALHHHDIARQ